MISFIADRVKLAGPRIDGNFTLTFDIGEYEYDKIKDVPKLNNSALYVNVSNEPQTNEGR